MRTSTLPSPLAWLFASSPAATGGKAPRKQTGPVMMGDIHGALCGRPLLLFQWERWEAEAAEDDDRQ